MSDQPLTLDSLIEGLDNDETLTKEASEKPTDEVVTDAKATSSIADELESALTKSAETTPTGDDSEMNTQETGKAIATQILEKLAAEGNNNGSSAGTQKVIEQTGSLVAGQDAATEPTPVEGKSVSETAKEILNRGSRDGGVKQDDTADALGEGGVAQPSSDGSNIDNVPSDLSKTAAEDDLEKIAAVATLMDEGESFDTAIVLVKEAAELIAKDETEQVKIASVNALIAEGIDLTSAVASTEQAMTEMAKEAAEKKEKEDKEDKDKKDGKDDKKDKKDMKGDDYKEDMKKTASVLSGLIDAGYTASEAADLITAKQ